MPALNDNTADLLGAPTSEQVADIIAAELDGQAFPDVTPRLRELLEEIGADRAVDCSEGSATILEWSIQSRDGLVTLTWGVIPAAVGVRRGFTLHRFNRAEVRTWGN